MALRAVSVLRNGKWCPIRLAQVQADDRIQINEDGVIVVGRALTAGFETTPGVGACEIVTDLISELVGAPRGKQTA
jgi:hypothetical protein